MPRYRIIQLVLMTALLLGLTAAQRPDGRLHVFFLETAGDAVLIQTPTGAHILVDGGADPVALSTALGRILPFWKRQIDVAILTLPDRKHLPGQVAALARYGVRYAVADPVAKQSAFSQAWVEQLRASGASIHIPRINEQLQFGGVILRVIAAGDGDTNGMVVELGYGRSRVLFAQSLTASAEDSLAKTGALGHVSLVAYPWQRDPRNSFVERLAPNAIVFSDGLEADQPAELTMPQRAVAGASLYHERLNGMIEWQSDGRQETISVQRRYCSWSSPWWARLFTPLHSASASCSSRDRS